VPKEAVSRADWLQSVRDLIASGNGERAMTMSAKYGSDCIDSKDIHGEATAALVFASALQSMPEHDHEDSLTAAERALSLCADIGDDAGELEAMRLVATAQVGLRMFSEAEMTANKAVNKAIEFGDEKEIGKTYVTVAEVNLASNEPGEAQAAAASAVQKFEEQGTTEGIARANRLKCQLAVASGDLDEAQNAALAAVESYRKLGDRNGMAHVMLQEAHIYNAEGDLPAAFRRSDEACNLFRDTNDRAGEADVLLMQAEVKYDACRDRDSADRYIGKIVTHVNLAVKQVMNYKYSDLDAVGRATSLLCRVHTALQNWISVGRAASKAARIFRKLGKDRDRACALLDWAQADYKNLYWKGAEARLEQAQAIFEKLGDAEGQEQCFQLQDSMNAALGLPTRAEVAQMEQEEQQKKMYEQQMLMFQQQQMMMAAMGQAQPQGGGGGGGPPQMPIWMQNQGQQGGGQAMEAHKASSNKVAERSGEKIAVAGLDIAVIKEKIQQVTKQIIDDDEPIESDMPLMEAGLTSNTAVVLRDALVEDLQGVSFPVTLVFDYPSIASIAEYVINAAPKK